MNRICKRTLALLLAVLLLCGAAPTAFAEGGEIVSGTCGSNVTWELNTGTGALTICGTGEMSNYSMYNSPWPSYRERIYTVTIENGVTSIGDCAFLCCENLTSVTIPDSVTSIGAYTFYWCNSLARITIPNNVTSIDIEAFGGCSSLARITIPDSVTSIGDGAFRSCASLVSILVSGSNASYRSDASDVLYNKDMTTLIQYPIGRTRTSYAIPDSVTSIGDGAFSDCTSLTSVTIPDSVTSIGGSAFRHCTSLVNITIPNSVTSIGQGAFHYCKRFTSITIPDSVTSISVGAFGYCSSLAIITIPNSVTSIGYSAFYNCTSLANITIPDSVTSIDRGAFEGCDTLTDVYYMGSLAEWESITIQDHNEPLLNATIHFLSAEEPYLTLHCPSKIYNAVFETYGVANPNAKVSLYDGETLLGTVQASETGNWRGSFTLQNPADPSEHTITATVTLGEQTASKSKTLTYDKKAVYPTAFTLTHSGKGIDMLNVRQVNLTVVPSKPMDFEVRLNTNEDVHSLEVISVKDAEIKSISASFDSAAGTWKASGWFDPANHSYVPGSIDLRINGEIVLLETAKVHYLIDPSGFVYEAVKSNRVEGATASIYVKDGADETLWNANRYEQDNPQTTDAFGMYHWDVTEGTWRVKVEKDGYETAYSDWMDVPPEWTEVAIPLVTTQAPQVADMAYDDGGMTVTFSQYMDMRSVSADNVTVQCGGTTVPVTVTPVNAEASGTDSTVSYASVFRVQPKTALAGRADIRIAGVKNYAGIALAQDATFTAQFNENGKVQRVAASDLSLQYKSSGRIQPVVTADAGVQYTLVYSGFDNRIISVDANGNVTALKKGTTTVTVKYAWWQILIRIFLLGFIWY